MVSCHKNALLNMWDKIKSCDDPTHPFMIHEEKLLDTYADNDNHDKNENPDIFDDTIDEENDM